MLGLLTKFIPGVAKLGTQWLSNKQQREANQHDVHKQFIKNNKGWRTSLIVIMMFMPFIFIVFGVLEGMLYQLYYWLCDLFTDYCSNHLTSAVDIVKSTNSYAGTFLFVELTKNLGIDWGGLLNTFILVGLPLFGGHAVYKQVQKNTMMKQADNSNLLRPTSAPATVRKKKAVRKPKI